MVRFVPRIVDCVVSVFSHGSPGSFSKLQGTVISFLLRIAQAHKEFHATRFACASLGAYYQASLQV